MKTCWILIFISLIGVSRLLGQTENKEFGEAEDLSTNNRFTAALPHYLNLLKLDSSNANLNFKIGICYLNSRSQKAKAVYFLNRAIMPTTSYYSEGLKKQIKDPIIPYKFLGTCHLSYNFDQVNNISEKFKKIILYNKDKDLSAIDVLSFKIEINKIGEELKEFNASSINLKIENTDKNHHSSFVDYSSVSSANGPMIFTFQKSEGKEGESDEEQFFFENINIPLAQADKGNVIGRIDSMFSEQVSVGTNKVSSDTDNNINKNEATIATSEDKQTILIYRDDTGDGNLYISRLHGNQWTTPEKVDKTINTKGWEPNECISADGSTLYFTSNRKGGFGGLDIYKCKKLPNGEWSKATNLGPDINTPYDERAPFIHADGVTLYFSSNGHKTIGSFDIFSSYLIDNESWSKPDNIGYPVNKIEDDTFYPVAADNKKNNSSKPLRKQIHGNGQTDTIKKTDNGDKDNYIATFINQKRIPLTILKSNVIALNEKVPEHLEITVTDNETGELVSSFNSNIKKEKHSIILPPERNNNITYQADGYLFHSDNVDLTEKKINYEINIALQMPIIAEGSKIILNNIFFDSSKATLRSVSKVELNNLFHLLNTNPGLKVKISDYMTSVENVKYNKKLSKERAQSIEQYLIEKGINKENIIAKGYVKSKTSAPKDERNKNTPLHPNPINQWVELEIVEAK